MKTIYIVEGQTGEYSDHQNWVVKAFSSEKKAKNLVNRLAQWCDENYVGENSVVERCDTFINNYPYKCSLRKNHLGEHSLLNKPEEDPDFKVDYTGTRYTYYSCLLEE